MVFITVGKQTEDRFLIVHEDSIRSTEDGAQLDGTALAFVLDRNDEFASDPMPIDSIIAHGHGMWDIRESLTSESAACPDADTLLDDIDVEPPSRVAEIRQRTEHEEACRRVIEQSAETTNAIWDAALRDADKGTVESDWIPRGEDEENEDETRE